MDRCVPTGKVSKELVHLSRWTTSPVGHGTRPQSELISPRCINYCNNRSQRAKKVVSDSPGLVDFAIGLVNPVLRAMNFNQWCSSKILFGYFKDSWASTYY